jgi:transposase
MDAPALTLNGTAKCQSVEFINHLCRGTTMNATTIGIDLAKNVFQIHGVDEHGKAVLIKPHKRPQVAEFFSNLPPCLIGMEACGSSHHWARKLQALGHTVKLMSPQFVKPYVKSNKNDAADALAICEAVGRPSMRFVSVKSVEHQAMLSLHRVRQGFVKARTAQANQLRGLLGEFGLIVPQGIARLGARVTELIEDASNELPGSFRMLVRRLLDHLEHIDNQVNELQRQILAGHRASTQSLRLAEIPGIGPITASAIVASMTDPKCFENGRQAAAWMGLVPRQHSSGGKNVLLGISKRGDSYLRTLLIHGARSVILAVSRRDKTTGWISNLVQRRGPNIASVALANKNARIAWALLAHGREFRTVHAGA